LAIKLFSFLSRRSGVDVETFQRSWRDDYAAGLGAQPAFRAGVLRYEQNHRIAKDYERTRDPSEHDSSFDGVAVLWFESEAAFSTFANDAALRAWSEEAAAPFLDVAATRWLLTREPDVIVDRPQGRERAGAKLISVFRRNPRLDLQAFRTHWREKHGPLYVDVPALAHDILAYDQNPRIDADYERDEPNAPGYDGVTEQWFESLDAFSDSLRLPENRELVAPDVGRLLDHTAIEFLMTEWPQGALGSSTAG